MRFVLYIRAFGININTVPVLDRLSKNTHPFLKDRVYSEKIKTIIDLSKLCIDTYKKNKLIIKYLRNFLFELNNLIGNIFFCFTLWRWKIYLIN